MKAGKLVATLLFAFALVMGFAAPAFATTYYGPEFSAPVSVAPGSAINIVLTTGSGSITPLPQGGKPVCTGTCAYPQQSWTVPTGCFYSVHKVTVDTPAGAEYMLGSSTTSGMYWPASLGGSGSGTSVPPQADALNVTVGDSFTIPFAAGAGGFSFSSVLGNPPNDVSTAGPYYWWSGGQRLDLTSVNPTTAHGTYTVDIEGAVVCPTGSTTFTSQLFFDSGIIITTPQFGLGIGLVVLMGVGGLLLVRKRSLRPLANPVH